MTLTRLPVIPHIPSPLPYPRQVPVLQQRWPAVDPTAFEQPTVAVKLQVAGRFRGTVVVPREVAAHADQLKAAVLASELAQRYGVVPSR